MGTHRRNRAPAPDAGGGKKAKPLAPQLKRTSTAKPGRAKRPHSDAIVRSWTLPQFEELPKEERDIVLDRIQKEVVDAVAIYPQISSCIVRGVNHVARLIAKRELRVVVFANNMDSGVFAHIPLLCRLHKIPICVLHLSSRAFGEVFGLPSLAVFGIKRVPAESSPVEDGASHHTTSFNSNPMPTELTGLERTKLLSISEFLVTKASKKNHSL